MPAVVREVLVLSDPHGITAMREALGDGRQWGLTITSGAQARSGGIADGLLIAEDFVGTNPSCLILGDNIFYGRGLMTLLTQAAQELTQAAQEAAAKAVIFTQKVAEPQRYGVVKLDAALRPTMIVEKPADPPSNQAVTGLYFYDGRAVGFAKKLKPSQRGELEITDLSRVYLERGDLVVTQLGRGMVWFDGGSPQNLLVASDLVQIFQARQRKGIAFPEEVAYRLGLIDLRTFKALVDAMPESDYRAHLADLHQDFVAAR
jgi:glucose-1-phosphate thymidylyltransferase